jgi:peptidoglycan hydrolase CwlO-like protein
MNRGVDSLNEKVTELDDLFEGIKDKLDQLGEEELKRLQSLVKTLRDSIDSYNYIFS